MKINKNVVYRYVSHEEVEKYRKLGWVFECNMQGHHAKYAVIMKKKIIDDKKNR